MRQFNHDDDDTDYAALKNERANDRESIKAIRDSCKIDENDLFAKLAAAAQGASPQQRRSAAARATIGANGSVSRSSSSMFSEPPREDYDEPAPRYETAPSKYAEIVDTLERFKFSNDDDRRKRQMKIVANTLRTALQTMVLEEVAVNTKTAFKGHAERVVQAPGGLKVYFNFDGEKFTVVAKGGFHGDETICLGQSNGKNKATVLRIDGDDFTDLSDSFEIILTKGQ